MSALLHTLVLQEDRLGALSIVLPERRQTAAEQPEDNA